jgi:hypothetical protein
MALLASIPNSRVDGKITTIIRPPIIPLAELCGFAMIKAIKKAKTIAETNSLIRANLTVPVLTIH